jgi:hypothetical protein
MRIAPFLEELSANQRPIVVTRDDGTLVGMVTSSSILKALAANASGAGRQARTENQTLQPDRRENATGEQRTA